MKRVNFRSFPKASFLHFFSDKPYVELLAQKYQLSAGAVYGIDITVSPIPTLGKETQHILVYSVRQNLGWDETEHVF